MATLRDIWNNAKNFGYQIMIEGKDGLKEWQPLKTQYSNYSLPGNAPTVQMKPHIKNLVEEHFIIGKDEIDYTDSKFKIDEKTILDNKKPEDHFFIQHFRIPKMLDYNLTVGKIAQIGYNAGQFSAAIELGLYKKNIVDFYSEHTLGDIETFISHNDANIIPSNLEERNYPGTVAPITPIDRKTDAALNIIGGNSYYKYIKYKNKYLKLKKSMKN